MKKFLILSFLIIPFVKPASACNITDAKEKITVVKTDTYKLCKRLRVLFPETIPAKEDWVLVDPFARFEVREGEEKNLLMNFHLEVSSSNVKDYLQTIFCLPDDLLKNGVLRITYEEESTKEPNKDGLVPVSFCMETIEIDNLDELAEDNKTTPQSPE